MEDGLTDAGITQQDIARREGPCAVTALHPELSRDHEGHVIVGYPGHAAIYVHLILRMVGSVDAYSRTTEQLGISRHGNPSRLWLHLSNQFDLDARSKGDLGYAEGASGVRAAS